MAPGRGGLFPGHVFLCLLVASALIFCILEEADAITRAIGQPYRGRLENGVPFPTNLGGYKLRCQKRAYATPELIGGLLDAIETVRQRYPDTVDLFIGDISRPGGGWLRGHRSHQNGRDVDVGMYLKGNKPLHKFIPMNPRKMDVAKTWTLIEGLLQTGRVQYMFFDRRLPKPLFRYALAHGWKKSFLDRLFYNVGRPYKDSVIRHARRHRDHIHVRFYAPWSTLAGRLKKIDPQKEALIELAQNAFLPKQVHYYVEGNEPGLKALARSFGVRLDDLLRWNNLTENTPLTPGMTLVYYRRAFELEPVHIASTVQPQTILTGTTVRLASVSGRNLVAKGSASKPAKPKTYRVRRGDTLWSIARRHGLSVKQLCRLNRISPRKPLRPGQRLTVGAFPSGTRKSEKPSYRIHTVAKGENLWRIARKYRTTVQKICRLNRISPRSVIRPGRRLKIPRSR